jgi:hypothetical protein
MTREKPGDGPRLSRAPRVRGTNLPGSPRPPMPAARMLCMLSDASSSYRTERDTAYEHDYTRTGTPT